MDLNKILEKKGIEAKDSDDKRMHDYSKRRSIFKDIPTEEYIALEKIASAIEEDINAYKIIRTKRRSHESLGVRIKDNHITELRVNGYYLESLPEYIGNLTSLKKLNLNNNELNSLPHSIGDLTSLRVLWAYNNKLTSLPDSIGELMRLEYLSVGNNQLATLPESIGDLINLRYLNIEHNKLEKKSKKLLESLKKKGVNVRWT